MTGIIWLILGGVLGWLLEWLDRLVYIYWSHPGAQLSQYVRYHFGKREFKAGWQLLRRRQAELAELTFRSALFQLVWVVLAVFALTSTVSSFGKGLVMGLGLHILTDEWRDYLRDRETLKRWLFWQIKRDISEREMKVYLYVMTGVFGLLTLLLLL
jgi:hypothetical protein